MNEQGGPEAAEGAAAAVVAAVVGYAERLLKEDVETNRAIGDHGANAILANAPGYVCACVNVCAALSLSLSSCLVLRNIIKTLSAHRPLDAAIDSSCAPNQPNPFPDDSGGPCAS